MSTIFEWDPEKAEANFKKHGVTFSEAEPVLSDEFAITIPDDESDATEKRFVTLGMGLKVRVLVVVYCYRREYPQHFRPGCRAQRTPGLRETR